MNQDDYQNECLETASETNVFKLLFNYESVVNSKLNVQIIEVNDDNGDCFGNFLCQNNICSKNDNHSNEQATDYLY